MQTRLAQVNGLPGAVVYLSGRPFAVFALQVNAERVQDVFAVLNPDKLRGLKNLEGESG